MANHQPSLTSEAVAMKPLQTTSAWTTLHTLAEVKGCFILRPWAYKLWEQIQVPNRFPMVSSLLGCACK